MHTVMTRDGAVEIGGGGRNSGKTAIMAIRNMLGKSSLASVYDKLTQQQRATVLYAARIKPSTAIDSPLMALTIDQREAVRTAIIALSDMGKAFSMVPCGREQILGTPKPRHQVPNKVEPANEPPHIDERLAATAKLAVQLMDEAKGKKRA
ncbi:hypothetical protein [Shewanella sp.]|uniref:hypothetical protein n=1 Tax=Shewanella sp. TaxID=50422 RepID=UPI003A984128